MKDYKRKKCAFGSNSIGRIKTVSDSLTQNELQNRGAEYQSDLWAEPLQILNSTLSSLFGGLDFSSNKTEDLIKNPDISPIISNPPKGVSEDFWRGESTEANDGFALGGKVGYFPVEVEGKEVAETPNGNIFQFNGPSHEEGGIKANLPIGTDIYSDRIKIDGKTIAERKKGRALKEQRLEKRLNEVDDPILKRTLDRLKENHLIEEEAEKAIQSSLSRYDNKAAYGLDGDDPNAFMYKRPSIVTNPNPIELENIPSKSLNSILPNSIGQLKPLPLSSLPKDKFDFKSFSSNIGKFLEKNSAAIPTMGDSLGLYGNISQGLNSLLSAENNAATDTPNENAFLNYGKEAKKSLENEESYLNSLQDSQESDLKTARNSAIVRNRRTARDINTMRTGDYAVDSNFNDMFSKLQGTYLGQLMNIESQRINLNNDIDRIVMGGEVQKDLANRQDKGARDTAIALGNKDLAKMISITGKDFNKIKQRAIQSKYLNQAFDFLKTNVMTGDISQDEKKKGNINKNYVYNNFFKSLLSSPEEEDQ